MNVFRQFEQCAIWTPNLFLRAGIVGIYRPPTSRIATCLGSAPNDKRESSQLESAFLGKALIV